METGGSGSLTESGSSKSNASSTPPPVVSGDRSQYGLKFGKKIYFEDNVGGGGARGASSSSSAGRKGGGGGPARCQVEGCRADLSGLKAYYSRHKVCGTHSKSPKVIVAALEQRFCQQCSRFHLLPEFDQGKRSCRRRLAGHNERRRKPQPGSVLSRCAQLCSTLSENSSRSGSFVLDFTAHPRVSERDAWPAARSSERLLGSEAYTMGRSISQPWQNSPQNPPSNLYLQGSSGGTGFTSTGISPGECFSGVSVSDSSCALSLLSNQQWGARNEAPTGVVTSLVNPEGAPLDQSTPHHGATMNPYSSPSWGYKNHEANSSLQDLSPGLGQAQISQPMNSQFGDELELFHEDRRQYVGLDRSRGYDSPTQHIQWSL